MEPYSLARLQKQIAGAVEQVFEEPVWVRAEISSLHVTGGHCYLDLVEKSPKDSKLVAKAQATIWARTFALLKPYFETTAGMPLAPGLQVLLKVFPRYHELYGLSLNVSDIDPKYTVGDVALERRKTWERLQSEGVAQMNASLPFPMVPRRVAVISSQGAAGFDDFMNHLRAGGYFFEVALFPAVMQGDRADLSLIEALDAVAQEVGQGRDFQVVLILRGGGAVADLHCYDSYALGAHIAQFPLPVITGIGHQRDTHIADLVAWKQVKTPTAAADFLVDCLAEQDALLQRYAQRLEEAVHKRFEAEEGRIRQLWVRLERAMRARFAKEEQQLFHTLGNLYGAAKQHFQRHLSQIDLLEHRLRANNPLELLKKGYSLTLYKGRAVRSIEGLQAGDTLTTLLEQGTVTSVIAQISKE